MSATQISEQDLRGLLDLVPSASFDAGGWDCEQFLFRLATLIPSACASYFVMDSHARTVVALQEATLANLPRDEVSLDLFFDAYWDCMPCSWPELSGDRESITMLTDFGTERDYARSLMAEYSRRCGVWYELRCCLPPQGRFERRIKLARAVGDVPYTERDRLLLTLLRPHLVTVMDRVEAQQRHVPTLTPRQMQLLRRVADGHTNRQIARDVGLAEGTVRKHLEHIYARLEVGSRTEALARMRDVLAS